MTINVTKKSNRIINVGVVNKTSSGVINPTNPVTLKNIPTLSTAGKSSRVLTNSDTLLVSGSTNSIAYNASDIKKITGYSNYIISSVAVSNACWLRVYTSNSAMMSDSDRVITVDPVKNAGVLLEVITESANSFDISPAIYAINNDAPASNTVYMRITNLSPDNNVITANLTVIKLGA